MAIPSAFERTLIYRVASYRIVLYTPIKSNSVATPGEYVKIYE